MAWQAMEGMTFSMVGGGGPGITPSRAGPEAPGFDVLARASLPLGPAPLPTSANLRAIRQAVAGWGVTTIVVPDQPGLPSYDRGRSVPYAVGLFTAALGRSPVLQTSAWVWSDAGNAGPAGAPVRRRVHRLHRRTVDRERGGRLRARSSMTGIAAGSGGLAVATADVQVQSPPPINSRTNGEAPACAGTCWRAGSTWCCRSVCGGTCGPTGHRR